VTVDEAIERARDVLAAHVDPKRIRPLAMTVGAPPVTPGTSGTPAERWGEALTRLRGDLASLRTFLKEVRASRPDLAGALREPIEALREADAPPTAPAPPRLDELHAALLAAFPTFGGLREMVYYGLEESLDVVTREAPLPERITALLQWAKEHGRFEALLEGALRANGDNPQLADWVERWRGYLASR